MNQTPIRMERWAVALLVGVIGCQNRPKAPALADSPVYSNKAEGLRFLVPDGWTQTASSALPKGSFQREVVLVQYRLRSLGEAASVEILCFDEAEPRDLARYHANASHGVKDWKAVGEADRVSTTGMDGDRFTFEGKVGEFSLVKEVVAFRRGTRVYNFIGLFDPEDDKSRQQIRRAVESIVWEKK